MSMGALSLPGLESRNALLRAYFEFTYPYMPILDISNFLGALTGQSGISGKVSLFLFQAILFSGAAHVQLDCLKAAGFATRKQAREELFRRVRVSLPSPATVDPLTLINQLLYDFNYESDPFVLVQGLLLMSLRYDGQDDHRNTWHWIDVAFSQAFMCQLHRDPEYSLLSLRARKLRRRVWWSCFIRDQLTSVEMKRLPRIRDGEYDVPTLNEDDFEFEDVHPEFATIWRAMCPYIGNKSRQKDMATLFIAKANLCHILAEHSFICHSINSYTTTGTLPDQLIESRSSNKNSGDDRLQSLKRKLEAWNEALPDCCRYRLPKTMKVSENTGIEWNAMVLQVMYRSLVLAIERTSTASSLSQNQLDQETAGIYVPVENPVAFEGFSQGTQFMETLENTNEPTDLAWVSPELVLSSSADCDASEFPNASELEEKVQSEEHIPEQHAFPSFTEKCCEIETAEDEDTQDPSLTSESLNGTSPSEMSTGAGFGFESLGYGDIAEAMFFDRNFGFRSDEFDALFSSDGEVLVVK